jgi:hypothetical protein
VVTVDLCQGLREWSTQRRATLFMDCCLAQSPAYAIVHTGMIIGSPVACRESFVLEEPDGFFVKHPSRWHRLAPKDSFAELSTKVKTNPAWRPTPTSVPPSTCGWKNCLQRDMRRSPPFDVMLVRQNNQQVPEKGRPMERMSSAAYRAHRW